VVRKHIFLLEGFSVVLLLRRGDSNNRSDRFRHIGLRVTKVELGVVVVVAAAVVVEMEHPRHVLVQRGRRS
jgi:hypothetical protein